MYSLIYHKNQNVEKWSGYAKEQQVLMIANELNRAVNLAEQNNLNPVLQCFERAFELIDLTTSDSKWHGHIKELRRLREQIAESYTGQKIKPEIIKSLNFALISMTPGSYNMLRHDLKK